MMDSAHPLGLLSKTEGTMTDPKPRPNHRAYLASLRQMTAEQKLRKMIELSNLTRELFLAGLKARFQVASDAEIRRIYLERLDRCHNRNY
jgi:hypothetical protein